MSELSIASEISELRRMSRWLARETSTLGLPETVRQDLDVCANEVVMNVISHAFDGDGPHEILLSIARAPNELQLAIEDEGSPFNPLAHPEHAPPASLESRGSATGSSPLTPCFPRWDGCLRTGWGSHRRAMIPAFISIRSRICGATRRRRKGVRNERAAPARQDAIRARALMRRN